MPKYISGRSKRRPQDQLSDDRYQYLGVDQSEPNLGDPVFPGETPPFGQQYITVSIEGYPGERYWIPNQGGIIPGSISIFDESNLVGAINSITQLNIVGAAISASGNSVTKATITLADSLTYSFSSGQKITQDGNSAASGFVFESTTNSGIVTLTTVTGAFDASGELEVNGSGIGRTPASIPTNTTTVGVAATIEVTPEYFSTNTQVVFNNNDEFDGALGLVYQNNSATDSSNVGLASVGIGTIFARRTLHVDGDIKLTGSIEDYNNSLGNTSDILVKNSSGGIEWIEQNSLSVGAAGTYYEIQFHGGTGTLAGADKLVYRSDLNGGQIGIGTTNPSKLLDVEGDSIFVGDVTFYGDSNVGAGESYNALWDTSENHLRFNKNAKVAFGTDSSYVDLEIYHNSADGYIDNETGHLYIRNTGLNDDSNIYIQARDGENSIVCNDDGSVFLYWTGTGYGVKAYTDSNGLTVSGRLYVNSGTSEFHGDVRFDGQTAGRDIYFDESENSLYAYDNAEFRVGTGGDVRIYHDASNTYIEPKSDGVGDLIVGSATTDIAKFVYNGGVSLYYQDVLKFDTIGAGVTVYGTAVLPQINTVGVATFDNVRIGYDNDGTIDTSGGNLILDSTAGTVQVDDILFVNDTTQSTSIDNGSIYTQGGVGIEKNLNVGGSVGIASTAESTSKDTGALIVEGGVGIEKNLNVGGASKFTGISTFSNNVDIDGHTELDDLNVSGIATLGVTTLTDVTAQQLNVSGITTLGVTTLTDVTAQQLDVSGITTLGITTLTDVTAQQLFVSGISTLGNVFIQPVGTGASVGEKEPGVSGVVTFYGDGSGLRNVVAIGTGIDIQNNGISVGSASTVNFGDNLIGSLDDGVYTVNVGNDNLIIQNGIQEWYIPDGYQRQLSPQVGTGITSNNLGSNPTRTTDAEIYDHIWDNYDDFDLDGDGIVSYVDILMLQRWRISNSLPLQSVYNAVWSDRATRNTDSEIKSFIQSNSSTYDVTGNGAFDLYTDMLIIQRVFGAITGPSATTPEAYEAFDFSNDTYLDPDDGGVAQFRTNKPIIGIGTTSSSLKGNVLEVYGTVSMMDGVGIGTSTLVNSDNILETYGTVSMMDGVGIGTTTLVNSDNILEVVGKVSMMDGVGIGTTTLVNSDNILEVYGSVSIADTTSNAGGARYISTEAPTAGVGQEGDIWYDVSSTADTAGTNGNIPVGGIIMWYGTITNIPASWALCDGTSYSTAIGTIDTPDLRDRFVVGAGTDTQNVWGFDATTGAQTFTNGQSHVGVGSTGGEVAHQLTIAELASHSHSYDTQSSALSGGGNTLFGNQSTSSTNSAGGDDYHENRPPYYALAYIMRIA